jgi:hypothetical protein
MALHAERGIVGRHSGAVVDDPDLSPASIFH